MFVIGFIEPMTWFVMVICGLVGALFSGEIILSVLPFWGNTKDENSKIFPIYNINSSYWNFYLYSCPTQFI